MNVLVLGGSGPLGLCILSQLVEAKSNPNYPTQLGTITALIRPTARSKLSEELISGMSVVEGDVLDPTTLSNSMKNQQIIVVSLGHGSVCHESMELLNQYADQPLQRIIVITSLGTNESYDECNFLTKTFVSTVIRTEIGHKKLQEDLLRSGPFSTSNTMDYVIVRPGGLRGPDVTGKYTVAEHGISGGMITRGDVAYFIVNELVTGMKGDKFSNKAVQIV